MSRNKLTRQQIKDRKKDYRFEKYHHGGSRIYINGEAGDRELLVDTYYSEAFSEYIDKCVREYFEFTD